MARATAAAFTALGYESRFIDYSQFAAEFRRARASGKGEDSVSFIGSLERVLVDQINKVKPDILLGIAQSPVLHEGLLDNLRKSGVITLYWFVEDFRVLTYWKWMAPFFDIFFCIQTGAIVEALAGAGANNHYYLPVAFDNSFEDFPVQAGARMPISFVGAPYPNRISVFEGLAHYNLKIYGEGWDSYPIHGVSIGNRRVSESEARSIYRNTEINMNLHSSMDRHVVGGDFVNPRTFELAGMGCFQLADRRELLPPLYAEDEVVQFGDESELIEKIEYYLQHEDRRKEIALNARRKTLRHHLYEHRVVEMMKEVKRVFSF